MYVTEGSNGNTRYITTEEEYGPFVKKLKSGLDLGHKVINRDEGMVTFDVELPYSLVRTQMMESGIMPVTPDDVVKDAVQGTQDVMDSIMRTD